MHRSLMLMFWATKAARPAAQSDLKKPSRPASSAWVQQFFLFALFFAGLMLLHAPLLRLPYFWDEAGYYVPAARDLFLTGTLIPQSTVSNAHPPLVMAWLALAWRVFGYSTLVTRTAMLALSAFSLLGLFRLSRIAANLPVAWATTVLVAIYPVYFTQSSLAQVDLPAAGFTFWALAAYMEDRPWTQVLWFSLAALAKETAILAPLALFGWEVLGYFIRRRREERCGGKMGRNSSTCGQTHARAFSAACCRAAGGLVRLPLREDRLPAGQSRILSLQRCRHAQSSARPAGSGNAALATLRVFRSVSAHSGGIAGHVSSGADGKWRCPAANSILDAGSISFRGARLPGLYVGSGRSGAGSLYVAGRSARDSGAGLDSLAARAVLEMDCGSGRNCICRRSVRNPPYGFSLEDNLAYRDYIVMHAEASRFLAMRYSGERVLTAWPASDELTRPWLGYINQPFRVLRIEDFSVPQIDLAARARDRFDVALVFSTKYQPPHPLFESWDAWQRVKEKFFGYHRDLLPENIAQRLGGTDCLSQGTERAVDRGDCSGKVASCGDRGLPHRR